MKAESATRLEGEKTFNGILLTFLSAGLVGIFFVVYLLPFFAQRVTHAVYDSAEMVEKDVMHDARSLMAQGDYEGAIEAFKQAAAADPLNRLPWVEIAKIQKDNLEIRTRRSRPSATPWKARSGRSTMRPISFSASRSSMTRCEGDRASAVAIMNQVIEQFPGTRHSANASHKLHEWAVADERRRRCGRREQSPIPRLAIRRGPPRDESASGVGFPDPASDVAECRANPRHGAAGWRRVLRPASVVRRGAGDRRLRAGGGLEFVRRAWRGAGFRTGGGMS